MCILQLITLIIYKIKRPPIRILKKLLLHMRGCVKILLLINIFFLNDLQLPRVGHNKEK